jgi:hypothetical protein
MVWNAGLREVLLHASVLNMHGSLAHNAKIFKPTHTQVGWGLGCLLKKGFKES